MSVLLRAASGPEVGVGHLMRVRAIAQALARRGASFEVVVDEPGGVEVLAGLGIEATLADAPGEWRGCEAAWFDGFRDWSDELAALGDARTVVAENRVAREAASLVCYPSMHWRPDAWDEAHPERARGGADWVPLSEELASLERAADPSTDLVVTFGGCDPKGLTELVLDALEQAEYEGRVRAVVGPRMGHRREKIEALAARLAHGEAVAPTAGIAALQADAHMAITAVGTTLYELAWLGVPALILANYRDDEEALAFYAEHGLHYPLGIAQDLSIDELVLGLEVGLPSVADRPVDRVPEIGGGADRVAALLLDSE